MARKKSRRKEVLNIWEIKNLDNISSLQKNGLKCWLEWNNRTEEVYVVGRLKLTLFIDFKITNFLARKKISEIKEVYLFPISPPHSSVSVSKMQVILRKRAGVN